MTAVQMNCPLCTGLFQTDSSLAGAQVMCPQCGGVVVVPASPEKPPEPACSATRQLGCPDCYRTFPVPIELAGSQAACPHCGRRVNVPLSWKTVPRPADTSPAAVSSTADTARLDGTIRARETASGVAAVEELLPPAASVAGGEIDVAAADDMLPPSAAPRTAPESPDALLPPMAAPDADSLLPPSAPGAEPPPAPPTSTVAGVGAGVAASRGPAFLSGATASRSAASQPGAFASRIGASGGAQTGAFGGAPAGTFSGAPAGVVVITTEEGTRVALREPVRVVGRGDDARELRTLSREEKERYRSLKSAIAWALCTLVLITALLVLVFVNR